jgi:LacI family gluconate utilization system Gnt-I transcriptional repressor
MLALSETGVNMVVPSREGRARRISSSAVTMMDVAKLAGVSPQTVSRVIGRPELVAEETRVAVQGAIAELNYIPNGAARLLASNSASRIIAVIIPNLASSVYASQVSRMVRVCERRGISMLIGNSEYSSEREEKLIQSFLERRPQGIIITGTQHSQRSTMLLQQSNIPVVETWDIDAPIIDMAVGFSNRRAGALVGKLLVKRNCKRIAFVGGRFTQDHRAHQRFLGLQDALKAAKLKPVTSYQIEMPLSALDGIKGMDAILAEEPLIDAIFFSADNLAMAALLECNRRGIRVPDQLAICGFGDYELSALVNPSLTTVRVPTAELGEAAANLILNRLANEPQQSSKIEIAVQLVRRGSA